MKLFDGKCAWFAPNVPALHINTWISDGGVQIRDSSKPIVQYYFSNTLDDETTVDLVRNQDKVLYRSTWVMDSSASRTKQPLGAYALSGSFSEQPRGRPAFQSPAVNKRRVTTARTNTADYEYMVDSQSRHAASVPRRPRSVATSEYYISPQHQHEYAQYRDNAEETQSIVSRSSRHSNASSILSSYGRRQPVSRFAIHADTQTIDSILADVADFTPNSHGFVAYKIPKLT
ncbi:hypothetical protein IW140_003816 [Coemansia sp. RSA 1813]|nr:hypothetical protein EV178_004543 [Coemansia sp. RSA 1646]KAJ1769744.1 hypothetical protein LPJ74_003769 [Coemansia sp. RSA 1843]KAJ2090097.1 hypothetical protein IW138_002907 [Coemansia sp. RSA 986]KAJ2214172.1 hypothetical protein EV179_003192 [Coemansia sp. RSA 487]KAJ2568498.1 hypothetical protein IW140_003816 [Coemansia sp. RSA 1813]